jgi:hypothetical protein
MLSDLSCHNGAMSEHMKIIRNHGQVERCAIPSLSVIFMLERVGRIYISFIMVSIAVIVDMDRYNRDKRMSD